MKLVTFRQDWDHVTPTLTTAYRGGSEVDLDPSVEKLARAAGVLEPDVNLKKGRTDGGTADPRGA